MASNESASDSQPAANDTLCTIVGVGASAGGLESFTQLLQHLPIGKEMAFVLIQHLAPTQPSLLTPLI